MVMYKILMMRQLVCKNKVQVQRRMQHGSGHIPHPQQAARSAGVLLSNKVSMQMQLPTAEDHQLLQPVTSVRIQRPLLYLPLPGAEANLSEFCQALWQKLRWGMCPKSHKYPRPASLLGQPLLPTFHLPSAHPPLQHGTVPHLPKLLHPPLDKAG